MRIVEFKDHHIADILDVENECFKTPWNEKMFKEETQGRFSHYYVAEVDDKAIGYMGMWSLSGEGHITNVAIARAHRNKGYAKALISHFIEIAKKEQLEFLTLEVRESNTPAISLYKSFGFTQVGIRKNYYENSENALLLTKFFGE